MEFQFGTPGSSSAGASSNTAATAAPASGSIFGSAAGLGSGTPSFSFGNVGGATAANASTPTGNTGSMFGQQSGAGAPNAAGGLFGAASPTKPPSGMATPPAGGLFGSKDSTTPPTGGGLFGGPKPAATTSSMTPTGSAPAGSGMFGGATPAAAPASALFAGAGNAFASKAEDAAKPQADAPTATPAKPLFSLGSTTPAGAPPDASKPAAATGLFGGQGTAGTSSNAGALFGAKPAAPSSAGGLFGGAAASSAPAASAAPANGPAASGAAGALFGARAAAGPTTATQTAASGNLFGAGAPSTAGAASTPTATAAPAGALFGSKPVTSATSPATTTSTTTSAAGALFGGSTPSATKPATALFGAPAAAGTCQPASTAATPATTAPAAATPAMGGPFGCKPAAANADKEKDWAKPSAQPGATSALGASTNGPTSQIPRLKNKTMEDIVTRWASDLSKYQKEFKEQATTVSTWDRNLVDNGEKIQKLYLDTFEAERASHEIERQLAAVESQQEELEAWLNRYETEVHDMFAKQMGPGEQLAGPDQERERTYKLAEKLTQQLDEKSRDLSKMVKEINDISGTLTKGAKCEDPLSQIVRVLNSHLTQLQWIDAHSSALQAKVAAAQKSNGALGSHFTGVDKDAAESFYRSYMGRR